MCDKPAMFQKKSGGLVEISNELLVFLLGRLAVEHPYNTAITNDQEIALAMVLSNSSKLEISKVKCLTWPENIKTFFDNFGKIKGKISFNTIDTSTAIGILQKILLRNLINTYRVTKKPQNPKCIKENHFEWFEIVNGVCTTCGLPEIIVYLMIGVEIKRMMRNTLKHATKDILEKFCSGTHRFDDFPSCTNEQDIYNENMRALQYILNFLADDNYFPKLKGITIKKFVEYELRMDQIIRDSCEVKILDLRTSDPLPRIELDVGDERRYLFEHMMEKKNLNIQHVPSGFLVFFDNTDIDEILLIQKKHSDHANWKDIQPAMETIKIYKRFELRGEESNSHLDIRMITTRVYKNDEQPYLLFTAVNQKVHDYVALRHITIDNKTHVHCHSFGDTITSHTLLSEDSFKSLTLKYEVLLGVSGIFRKRTLTNPEFKDYLRRYYGNVDLITFPITHRRSPPPNDFEHVFQLIEDAHKQIKTSDSCVIIIRQVDLFNILEILGVDHKQFGIQKTDVCGNLIIFNTEIHTICIINVTDQTTMIGVNKALNDVCQAVKSFLVLMRNFLSKHTLTVKGMLATTRLNKQQLHHLLGCEECIERDIHLTQEDMSCSKMVMKFEEMVDELEEIREESFQCDHDWFFTLPNLLACFMACRRFDLPLPVGGVDQMIRSIQLTYEQLEIIYSPENHKIIRGPFGSGKTILAKELVRLQSEICDRNGGVLYFISMDGHTLFNVTLVEFCKSLKRKNLFSTNILEISEESGADKMLNLPQVLKYLSTKHKHESVNVVLDEFDSEDLNDVQAAEIKTLLQENYLDQNVTVIVQSIEKTRTTKGRDRKIIHKSHCFHETGMKIFNLFKTLRYSVCINDLVAHSQIEISQHKSVGKIQATFKSAQPSTNFPMIREETTEGLSTETDVTTPTLSPDTTVTTTNSIDENQSNRINQKKTFLQTKPDQILKTSQEENASATFESLFSFFEQNPGHMIKGNKPRILRLDPCHKDSSKALCYFLSRTCFPRRNKKGLIVCNTERYFHCIIKSLEMCNLQYLEYMVATRLLPCLSSNEKKCLYKQWSDSKAVLVTDSAGCRGLEEEKVVLVVDENEHHERHLFVESACRSISELYIISFKCRKEEFLGSIEGRLSEVFDELLKARLLEDLTKICFHESVSFNYESFHILDFLSSLRSPDRKTFGDIFSRYSSSSLELNSNAWTHNELYFPIFNKQFDELNDILLSLNQLSIEQKSGDYKNYTLLHSASKYHAPISTMKLLHEKGCNLWERNFIDDLPIHIAALSNNFKAVEWMLREDITLSNVEGSSERTPLHCAAFKNHKETVELLLVNGADVNAETRFGKKAYELSDNGEIKTMIRMNRNRW